MTARQAQQAKKHKGNFGLHQRLHRRISNTTAKRCLGREGMLTLDIVRPDTQKNLPVLVYIHGGNNQASNSHLMEGNRLAQETTYGLCFRTVSPGTFWL